MLKDIYPGIAYRVTAATAGRYTKSKPYNDSSPGWLTDLNGTLLFAATDGTNGRELWRSDGTAKGTVLVKDLAPGLAGPDPEAPDGHERCRVLRGPDGLWKTDGTAAGTVHAPRRSARPTPPGSPSLTAVNGTLYFAVQRRRTGRGLWKSDGTAAGTVLVRERVGHRPGERGRDAVLRRLRRRPTARSCGRATGRPPAPSW